MLLVVSGLIALHTSYFVYVVPRFTLGFNAGIVVLNFNADDLPSWPYPTPGVRATHRFESWSAVFEFLAREGLWFGHIAHRGLYALKIPLWFLLMLTGVPTILLWRYDRARVKPGCCAKCGYDLTGNMSGRCPECGAACGAAE